MCVAGFAGLLTGASAVPKTDHERRHYQHGEAAGETAFDTSLPERLRLVQARVSEDVIMAMIAAEIRMVSAGKFLPGRDGVSYPRPITQPRPQYTDAALICATAIAGLEPYDTEGRPVARRAGLEATEHAVSR